VLKNFRRHALSALAEKHGLNPKSQTGLAHDPLLMRTDQ
jgi:hypothetical protein